MFPWTLHPGHPAQLYLRPTGGPFLARCAHVALFAQNVAGVIDPPLKSDLTFRHKINLCFYLFLCTLLCYVVSSVPSNLVCPYVLLFHTYPCHKFKVEIIAYLNNFG